MMPAWPGGPPLQNLYQQQLEQERFSRLQRFATAWKRYGGEHPRPLVVRVGQPDDNVPLNLARVVVDKGASFLFGQALTFEVVQEGRTDPLERSPMEEWLDACWRQNRGPTLLHKLALNGGVCGHTFLKIVRDPTRTYPRLVVLDPAIVEVVCNPSDLERVWRYVLEYTYTDPETGKVWLHRQRHEPMGDPDNPRAWEIIDERRDPDGRPQEWRVVNTELWAFPFPAIVDGQSLPVPNQYWGMGDLEPDVLALNAALNFTLSNLQRILRYHASPKTWASGMGGSDDLNIAADGVILLPSPESKLGNLEMLSDLSSSIELYKRLKEGFHEVARIPEVATGKVDSIGNLSGVALQILYQPLIELTETKRRTYGDLLAELNRRLLIVGGHDEQEVATQWPELLPGDPKAEAETLAIHETLGVSKRTLIAKLGYDPETEAEQREAEQADVAAEMGRLLDSGRGALRPDAEPPTPPTPRQRRRTVERDGAGRISALVDRDD